jgi:DnaJ-domain-containing protein 1
MIYHFPVQWPVGWPRHQTHKIGHFKIDYNQALRDLGHELKRLRVESAYISTDRPLKVDGRPRIGVQPDTPAVAVYFVRKGKQLCIPCDKYQTVRDNIRAIGLMLESIRRMERYGTSQMVEATLSGFAALPENASPNTGARPWYDVLEVSPKASPEVIKASFRAKAAQTHPDAPGGSTAAFEEAKRAYDQGMEAAA